MNTRQNSQTDTSKNNSEKVITDDVARALYALRRRTELGLLLFVFLLIGIGYVLASLGKDAVIPANILPFFVMVLVLLIAAHIGTRKFAKHANPILLPLVALLNGIGYIMIVRLNEKLAWQQAMWTMVGIGGYLATLVVVRKVRVLERYRYTFMLVGLCLLLLPLVPGIGKEINGSRIWLQIGPISFQPAEFAKIVLAIFFAAYLVEKRELLATPTWGIGRLRFPDLKHLGPVFLAWMVSLIVMVAQKDLGSSLLFFGLFLVMVWVATQRFAYLGVGTVLFTAGAYSSWRMFHHVQQRVSIWIDPWLDPKNKGYQIVEAWFAMAFGGVTGTGLGLSGRVNIPVAENDFIFAMIAQELGLFGATIVLAAFLLIVGVGLRIAIQANHPFETLLATGLTVLFGLQAFVIIGGVTRLLPLTGVALPFVSYGGSSLVSSYVLLALLMRISDESANSVFPKNSAQKIGESDIHQSGYVQGVS